MPNLKHEIAAEIQNSLKNTKTQLETKQKELLEQYKECEKQANFELGLAETFMEVEITEELAKFYAYEKPAMEILLIAKILFGLLGKWDLISENDEITWKNIKTFFKEEMKDAIGIFSN